MGKMDFPDRTNRFCRTIMATESYCSRESIIFKKENSEKYRAPTIRELASLMGFPIDYQFSGKNSNCKHKQIGNAVCIHLSIALARAIKNELNMTMSKEKRIINTNIYNLNNEKNPIYLKIVPKPLKLNVHVPYMKIKQLRVELDNLESDFENENIIWNCYLHKGSGKNAVKTKFLNNDLIKYIKNMKHINKLNNFIENEIKLKINDSLIFQKRNCDIDKTDLHYSPFEILNLISEEIKSLNIKDEIINIDELDKLLNYNNTNDYPLEVIYSLYLVNELVNNLH